MSKVNFIYALCGFSNIASLGIQIGGISAIVPHRRPELAQIQMNDQEREFVNDVSEALHKMTGTEQRVTSAYHPQGNGLCERHNRTIKEALVKVINEDPAEWPNIIDGVLFAHRVSRHSSTKYSP